MHPTWRHSGQSPNVTDHCYHTFGFVGCWLYQHWDNDGVGSIPNVVNLLVFCDNFTKHTMVYISPHQTAKTLAKFLWQGLHLNLQSTGQAPEWLRTNFESNIIRELCEHMGMRKVRTLPYYAQTNGQVEWAHQTPMCMIGKLSKDLKEDWQKHLPKLPICPCLQFYKISHHQT